MNRRCFLTAVLLAAMLRPGADAAAQTAADPRPVTLDLLVTSAAGDVPTDLTAADVVLKVGGKVRPLLSLERVAPPTAGRNVLLLVDEPSLFALEPVVRDAISKMLTSLTPSDRVAYVSTRRSPRKEHLRDVAEVISAAQINLHLLTVDHVSRSWGLDTLAANTGGSGGLLTWADASGLERAVTASSGFYRATFAADAKAPERPQRVDLCVNRPKMKVQTSPTVVMSVKNP